MDDSKELNRTWAGSLILGAGAAEIVKQNKWMNNPSNEQRAQAGHRDHLSTHWQVRGEEEVLSTLHVGAGTPKGSLRYESASKSKSRLTLGNKKTCAQRGHMTFVPRTFPSGNNEPALSSPHLWFASLFLFLFYPEKQRLFWSQWTTNERMLSYKK